MKQHNLKLEKLKRMPFDAFYVSLLSEKYKYGKTQIDICFFHRIQILVTKSIPTGRGSSVLYVIRKKD
ncbi:MAG: hypothetical protein R3B93_04215 [Bacteroidia bacterium]